jgi:hypothetical protein
VLSAYHFTFWIHALKDGAEAAPMCACDFSIEKSKYYLHTQICIHLLFNLSPLHFSLSILSNTVQVMTFLWKKASPFSPKTYQNGENSMADNSTMTEARGKVSIHLGSSWL